VEIRSATQAVTRVDVAPGAVWIQHYLAEDTQRAIAERAVDLLDGPNGGYVPTVRGGGKMHVRMLCLGRHWNPLTYRYESTRADHDGAPAGPIPPEWVAVARDVAAAAGFDATPDVCLINWYGGDGRMGLHQDKDESRASIEKGAPIVSLSIGDTARFLFGGERRRDPIQTIWLESGDAFVFGGPARLRYHGVSRIVAGPLSSPLSLGGRLNLTFRVY
jgi:alkylated DNA repair protein (DNA oxidative demethylase)